MKKLMTLGLFVISSALLIAACGGGGKPAANSGKKGGAATDDTMRLPVPDDFKSKTAPDLTDADLIEKGKALYLDPVKANCIMCHGESGKGDGPQAGGGPIGERPGPDVAVSVQAAEGRAFTLPASQVECSSGLTGSWARQ